MALAGNGRNAAAASAAAVQPHHWEEIIYMFSQNGKTKGDWLLRPKPNPQAAVRLFCFPYSGAGASVYYKWSELLPSAIELCPVQLPGRETRLAETPFAHLGPMVDALAEALLPYFDKPFAFFGHSMGALVSYELSRRLQQQHGIVPEQLLVSGHGAPHLPDDDKEQLHQLPEPQFIEKLRELEGTPEEVLAHEELRALLLPILRVDFQVCETYTHQPGVPLPCPIAAFGGLQDQYVSRERLAGWQTLTKGAFSLRMFPGGHFYLNNNRLLLLKAVTQELGVR